VAAEARRNSAFAAGLEEELAGAALMIGRPLDEAS
jgi:hypothetical protein